MELLFGRQVLVGHLEARRAHRTALLHVHVLEALVNVSTRRDEAVPQFRSFHFPTPNLNELSFFPAHRTARLCTGSQPIVLLVQHDHGTRIS